MRLAPTRLVPFSYFWICWKVRPSASPSFSWLMPSIMRRIRTRLPTYLSTGFGALVDIPDSPWDQADVPVLDSHSSSLHSSLNAGSNGHSQNMISVRFGYDIRAPKLGERSKRISKPAHWREEADAITSVSRANT